MGRELVLQQVCMVTFKVWQWLGLMAGSSPGIPAPGEAQAGGSWVPDGWEIQLWVEQASALGLAQVRGSWGTLGVPVGHTPRAGQWSDRTCEWCHDFCLGIQRVLVSLPFSGFRFYKSLFPRIIFTHSEPSDVTSGAVYTLLLKNIYMADKNAKKILMKITLCRIVGVAVFSLVLIQLPLATCGYGLLECGWYDWGTKLFSHFT